MTHIKNSKIYQFCVCEEIHDKTSWNWGSYWNCVLLEILSVLSILCSSHFVQGLQVRGECKIISQKWDASERRVWSPSVHQQAASMCVQNTTFQHIVSRLHALLGPSVSSPWHQSQHNHLTVRSTFFFLTSLLDFSHFFVWAQNPSFHSQHPHGNLLPFLSQFSDVALPWFPTSTSPFLFQTPCWSNAMVSIGLAINRLL